MSDDTSQPSETSASPDDSRARARLNTVVGVNLRSPWAWFGIVASIIFATVPLLGNDYYLQILFLMLMWTGLATSWNIIGGYTGYVSFGHGAFFALGGFTIGLGQQHFGLAQTFGIELIGMLLLAGLVPTVIAALIAYPFLRLSGGYFAIAMLGFQLAMGEAFTSLDILGGGVGIGAAISNPPVSFLTTGQTLYYLLAVVVVGAVLVSNYIRREEFGYGLLAIRENEAAAESVAIPTTRYKMMAFIISAFFPGIIGGLYVYHLAFFTSQSLFNILFALNMIVYAVVGGLGTVAGPFIGSVLLIFVKNVMLADVSEAHVFLTGLFIAVVMLGFPRGIVGIVKDYRAGELTIPFLTDRD